MLKYEKFKVISQNASYLEEMLFKYEKNIEHHQVFEKKGRALLYSMIELEPPNQSFQELDTIYKELLIVEGKLNQLQKNQRFVFDTLSSALNQKIYLGSECSFQTLREVYLIQKHMGNLQNDFVEDVACKQKIIRDLIPRIVFENGTMDWDEKVLVALDLWNHHNKVGVN